MPEQSWILFWILMIGFPLFCAEACLGFPVSLLTWRGTKIWWLKLRIHGTKLVVGIELDSRQTRYHTLDEGGQTAFWRAMGKLEGVFAAIVADLKGTVTAQVDVLLGLDMGSWDMRYSGGNYEQHVSFAAHIASDQEPKLGCVRIAISKWRPAWLANWQLSQEIMLIVLEAALQRTKLKKATVMAE